MLMPIPAKSPARLRWIIFIVLSLLALAIRLPHLSERPMHTDEAVNAYITGQLLAGENYHYDPQDRHGPALYLAALPIAKMAGAKKLADLSEFTVRLVPVIWGALTILLFFAVASEVGLVSATFAALLFVVAPLPVYYNRYFIHETLFVAATLALILTGWRTLENKSNKAAVAAGVSAGFMLACKETALLHFAAFGVAGLWWGFVRRDAIDRRGLHRRALIRCGLIAFAAFVLLVLALYTWGGQHWQGPLDLIRAIPRFASRASGEGHEKAFGYYFKLLSGGAGWTVLVFSIFGVIAAFQKGRTRFSNRDSKIRVSEKSLKSERTDKTSPVSSFGSRPPPALLLVQLLSIYGIVITLLYSTIPYKTPWLALNLWLPISLVAGFGFAVLWKKFSNRIGKAALLLIALLVLAGLGRDTWKWCFQKPADERNPYAYSHTGEDLLRLPERLNELIAERKTTTESVIAVVAKDPWPLPWYLRKFSKVGFWQPDQKPGPADFYITSLEATENLAPQLENWRPEFFGVRPEVLILLWTPPTADSP
ncbi:MAG TPA: flippase activity-associated protein Agl23 [Verrucomicrobiae bacterium]|nr:flippase activity-associated protein Agl23 [Verrucomicrobiae bacterium]